MITIRKATLNDAAEIAALDIKLYQFLDKYKRKDFDHLPFEELHPLFVAKRRKYVRSKQSNLFVADENGKLVGYVTVSTKKRPSMFRTKEMGYIGSIYVDETKRHQGIAQRLIDAALNWLKEKDITFVDAEIDVLNDPSVALFKQKGFEPYQYKVVKKI